jgi:hypothetical protein
MRSLCAGCCWTGGGSGIEPAQVHQSIVSPKNGQPTRTGRFVACEVLADQHQELGCWQLSLFESKLDSPKTLLVCPGMPAVASSSGIVPASFGGPTTTGSRSHQVDIQSVVGDRRGKTRGFGERWLPRIAKTGNQAQSEAAAEVRIVASQNRDQWSRLCTTPAR